MTREEEIKEMAKIKASHITSDKDMQVAFADALRSGAEWADSHPNWVSVEDDMPKIGKDVLVLREDGEMQVAHQYNEVIARWWSVDGFPLKNNITHWMPFQFPEKGGEE